jgi:hypothetical protein
MNAEPPGSKGSTMVKPDSLLHAWLVQGARGHCIFPSIQADHILGLGSEHRKDDVLAPLIALRRSNICRSGAFSGGIASGDRYQL